MAHHYVSGPYDDEWYVFIECCGGYDDPQELGPFENEQEARTYAYESNRDEAIHMSIYNKGGLAAVDATCPCPTCNDDSARCVQMAACVGWGV